MTQPWALSTWGRPERFLSRPVLTLLLALAAGALGSGTLAGAESTLPFKPLPVPGGVAVVPVQGKGTAAPKVTFRGEPVLTRRGAKGWVAVVGIPLSAKAGQESLEVEGAAVPFTVKPKHYPEQRVTLKNQRQVTPNAEDEARIAKEQLLIAPARKAWPEGYIPSLSFQRPTPGALTASFGMRRIFNGEPRSPHARPRASPCGRPPREPWC